MKTTIDKELTRLSDTNKNIEKFSDLLESIDTLEDKKKFLWKQIYENAVIDRENAHCMYISAKEDVDKPGTGMHAIIGPVLVKYIERMTRANDQLIRLAELISDAIESSVDLSPDEIYGQINKQTR